MSVIAHVFVCHWVRVYGVARAWTQWIDENFPDGNNPWHQDDVQEAFKAGWEAAVEALRVRELTP